MQAEVGNKKIQVLALENVCSVITRTPEDLGQHEHNVWIVNLAQDVFLKKSWTIEEGGKIFKGYS